MYTRQLFVKNGIFLAAIAGVFAACQQGNNKTAATTGADSSRVQTAGAAGGAGQKLAYVDIDSLEAHYNYFKERKQNSIEKRRGTERHRRKGKAIAERTLFTSATRPNHDPAGRPGCRSRPSEESAAA